MIEAKYLTLLNLKLQLLIQKMKPNICVMLTMTANLLLKNMDICGILELTYLTNLFEKSVIRNIIENVILIVYILVFSDMLEILKEV
jgi:hypothetical protein